MTDGLSGPSTTFQSDARGLPTIGIPFTAVTLRSRHGEPDYLETDSSAVLFARLHTAAVARDEVLALAQGGRALTQTSLDALNCYLRSYRIGRRGLPWHRVHILRSKYEWRAFIAHLELAFEGSQRTCRVCGCTDHDCSGCIERTGEPCHWVAPDLCSACVGAESPPPSDTGLIR